MKCEKMKVHYQVEVFGSWSLLGKSGAGPRCPSKQDYTESNTHTPSWLRSEVEVFRWLMDGSVHLPASDGWSHPVHQLTVGFTDPLCRQETEKETHSSKNRKNWCNLCVWLKPKQWTMCIFLSAATSTSEAARLWFAGVLISCFLKSGSVLSAPARWLTQLLIPV